MLQYQLQDGTFLTINGPQEIRCERCGKHVDELHPFDWGHDMPRYFAFGHKLTQNYRPMGPYDPLYPEILQDLDYGCDFSDLEDFFGSSKVYGALAWEASERSWECKDCFPEPGEYRHYTEKDQET